jgi:hypothetical protein
LIISIGQLKVKRERREMSEERREKNGKWQMANGKLIEN